jgi:16S rRNA U516 pseudouridylate synthase RsuA-like enzyme
MKKKGQAKDGGQISVVLPEDHLKQLRTLADAVDCSIGDLIRRAIGEWFISADAQTLVKRAAESMQIREQISNLATLRSNVSKYSEK